MSSQSGIDLSIIIPTYNRLPLLKEAIESFHGKLKCSYEVIIVDDGSSDATVDYLKLLKDPFHVSLISHQGPQVARNVGMRTATGQYLKFLDDDDVLEPEAVDAQVAFMGNNPDIDVSYSDWGLVTYRNDQIHKRWLYIMNEMPDPIEYFVMDWWCAPFVYLFRYNIVEGLHWDNTRVLTDLIFVSDVILRGARFGYLPTAPTPLGWYRSIVDKSLRLSQSASNVERAHCELNVLGKMEIYVEKHAALTEARKRAFATRYFRIARRIFPDDRNLFRQLVKKVKQLDTQFEPEGERYQLLIRWLGHENAEWLRRYSHVIRAKLRSERDKGKSGHASASDSSSLAEIIRIQVDKQTIVPKT